MITSYLAQQPVDDFGLRFASIKYSAMLAADTDTSFTVPGSAPRYKAVIKTFPAGSAIIWASVNSPASAPAGASLVPTSSEIIEVTSVCREVVAGDVLHFLSQGGSAPVSIVLYAINTNN